MVNKKDKIEISRYNAIIGAFFGYFITFLIIGIVSYLTLVSSDSLQKMALFLLVVFGIIVVVQHNKGFKEIALRWNSLKIRWK